MENMGLKDTPAFPLTLLKDITNNFSEECVIGRGGSGVVYKGVFDNGEVIAVKKLNNQYDSSSEKIGNGEALFHNELMNLIGVQHPNIVRLVGYCYEIQNIVTEYDGKRVLASVEERILCLEYLQGGSLKDHISDESCGLTWYSRYNIIKGICEGLKHLHTGSDNPIYHLDLKPENILLDRTMIPKIGDFGISRLPADSMQTCVTENISGTLGYMPPEYLFKKQISPKFDIFSLGVIMIHIIAGHEGNQNYPYMPSQEFIELVHENWRKQLQATVPRHTLEQVRTCTKLALRCVEFDREKRPDIREIIDELNKVDADGTSDTGQNTEEEEHTALDKQPETEEQEEETEHLEYKKNTQVNSRYTRAYHMLESVDLATGSLGSLLSKVLLLIQDYRTLSVELGYLCMELEFMQDSLQKVAVVPLDQLDGAVKLSANEARDLSYATENIVDSYLMSFPPPKSNFMDQAILAIRRIKDRRELRHMINGIIKNIQKMNNRRRRQNAEIVCYQVSLSAADPCLSALNKDPEEMVGVEVSRDEVIRKLAHGTDGVSKQLNIVSIVGMAGLGKTTLARAVYGRLQEQFDCSAFVSVSQHPDMKKVLTEILCQIDNKIFMDINIENFEGRMPIDELRILLADKR
ncbi:cysteine-rich receptor-like protein kinase 6 [Triticum dicoccoides]|uniref:cysteine-rich receptor-like protein kinase 6 n=1 Tax=Triticum dicoccoides TaxID=85692 RepID=UPI001890FA63|nr:cysteine-rich receptor-like protein kinase 6 [Triticum dicoccoides]